MNCTVCGHLAEEHDRFCSACGSALSFNTEKTGIIPIIDEPSAAIETLSTDDLSTLSAGAAQLVVRSGPLEGVRFTLPANRESTISIGRAPENDIFLDDVTVSRKHARFEFSDLGWFIHDSGSLNGTYVNRQRVDALSLQDQDEVQIGKYRFIFVTSNGLTES
jgi:pSer/pThr/pTyr-binding forkhead associated (FHA) protein